MASVFCPPSQVGLGSRGAEQLPLPCLPGQPQERGQGFREPDAMGSMEGGETPPPM